MGNENTKLIDNLCQQCYIELHPLLQFPLPLQLKLCKKCNRYYLKNRWISSPFESLEHILDSALKDVIPLQVEISPQAELEIKTHVFGKFESILKTNSITIDIQAIGHAHETLEIYPEVYKTRKVNLIFTVCPSCLSLRRGEYQAVLHILTPNREMLERERDYILSLVENESVRSTKLDFLAYITKFTMKKGKISFYIGSEKFARSLASIISYNLGGFLKETYKFGSRKIPKEVKRNKLYISLYLPTFVNGDLLWANNAPLFVIKVQGKSVVGINLTTHEKFKMPLKVLKNAKILQHWSDIRSFIYFSQTNETIQLMDLKNYEIFDVQKSSKYSELEVGRNIKGFEVDGKLYLIPNNKK
ncbi:MAG: hypothetical protein HWN66_08510 [Candidatus Helarchaeota archaeon]|nr:hypothetical protein [Candidatus Helarchaeota archaeon]